jgi:hypothetical protein
MTILDLWCYANYGHTTDFMDFMELAEIGRDPSTSFQGLARVL